MDQESECGMLIKQISDRIARITNNELREHELTLSQLRYIGYLYQHRGGAVPFKDIETHFEVAQPTVAGILRRLEGKQLVRTQPCKAGGKAKTACLTEAGRLIYERSEVWRCSMETALLSPLNDREKMLFRETLKKVYENLRESHPVSP